MRSPAPANPVIAIATDSDAGERLDRFLARALPDLTRTRVKALIEDGRVAEGGTTIREPSRRVKPGEAFALDLPPAAEPVPQGEAIALDIVYEDDDLLVLDKPAGLVVHPAPGNPAGTLVNALIAHCGAGLSGIGGVRRPGIVHRLDKDTSGLMVVAKTDRAHQGLAGQFKAHSLARAYLAVVWGLPAPPTGTIEGAIGRDPRDRKRMAVVAGERGKPALTRYRVLRRLGPAALVECRLATGRTHQIRVHLAERGHPVVGDPLYGGGLTPARRRAAGPAAAAAIAALGRQALHANVIGFDHPLSGEHLEFARNPPDSIAQLIDLLAAGAGADAP